MDPIDLFIYCIFVVLITFIIILIVYCCLAFSAKSGEIRNVNEENESFIRNVSKRNLEENQYSATPKPNPAPHITMLKKEEEPKTAETTSNGIDNYANFSTTTKPSPVVSKPSPESINIQRIEPFVKQLQSSNIEICIQAAEALKTISARGNDEKDAIVQSGAVMILLNNLNSGNYQLQKNCLQILVNLSEGNDFHELAIIDAGGVKILIKKVESKNDEIAEEALLAISNICSGSEKHQQIVVEAIVHCQSSKLLVMLLNSSNEEISYGIFKALTNLSAGNNSQRNVLLETGLIPILVPFLIEKNLHKCEAALFILINLIGDSLKRDHEIVRSGAIPALAKLLKSENKNICKRAALILEQISCGTSIEKQAIVHGYALGGLINLVENGVDEDVSKAAVGTLLNISLGTSDQRQAVIQIGAIPHLSKLLTSKDKNLHKKAVNFFTIIAEEQKKLIHHAKAISSLTTPPIVIEFGSRWTKYGLGGEFIPRKIVSSFNKNPSNGKIVHVLDKILSADELYKVINVFLKKTIVKDLLNREEERPVMIVENLFTDSEVRRILAKVLFEEHAHKIPLIIYAPSPLMNILPFGAKTALVIDIGFYSTTVFPVLDFKIVLNAFEKNDVGGGIMTARISEYLLSKGKIRDHNGSLRNFTDKEKEEFEKRKVAEDITSRFFMVTRMDRAKIIHDMEDKNTSEEEAPIKFALDVEVPFGTRKIVIPGFLRESAAECFFENKERQGSVPIQELILRSLAEIPTECHGILLNNMLVVGSAAGLPGMLGRIKAELKELLLKNPFPDLVNEVAFLKMPKENKTERYSSWLGGSLFAEMDELIHRVYTKFDWNNEKPLPDWSEYIDNYKHADVPDTIINENTKVLIAKFLESVI